MDAADLEDNDFACYIDRLAPLADPKPLSISYDKDTKVLHIKNHTDPASGIDDFRMQNIYHGNSKKHGTIASLCMPKNQTYRYKIDGTPPSLDTNMVEVNLTALGKPTLKLTISIADDDKMPEYLIFNWTYLNQP